MKKPRNKIAINPLMKKGGPHQKDKRKDTDKLKMNKTIDVDLLDEIDKFLDRIDQ